jgi:hypothetical protein
VVFRKLASGGGVIALPQRPRRAGGACAPSRNGRVSPSTLAPTTHPEAVMGVFESRPIARDAVARCLRPLQPRSIRSRRSQGRRPYEPSVRRDGGSVAHRWTGSGRTVRETDGVLKRLRIFGATVTAKALNPAFLLPMRGGRAEGSLPTRPLSAFRLYSQGCFRPIADLVMKSKGGE